MKAVEVVEKELKLIDFPRPEPGPDEVLIKVKATAVNRADLMQKNGLYPPPPGASQIMGLECSGTIEAVGLNVSSRIKGEEVCALLAGGGYAEYVTCPAEQVVPTPKGLNWIESASIPEVYATCWLNLFMEANLKAGEKVVFHAGASGIGTAGIQLCNNFDCETFVTAGSQEKINYCKDLGASGGSIRGDKIFDDIEKSSSVSPKSLRNSLMMSSTPCGPLISLIGIGCPPLLGMFTLPRPPNPPVGRRIVS